ncbi:hypothetical protein P775_06175 [Puniceibacterium antarcticum]|uniref:Uncharacterized protein n=1 Tax=Puniceibacterium antarcticum TaxID=1206336 RepID=A0A2G8RIA5_9RHOB|nr:hypothetical protein [Puniceibacterium antarcticum]PIL21131.1 hypothetical protein P775_06175 [Puniceibacterium antarcticum]
MMTRDRKPEPAHGETRQALQEARPEQIERLLQDILKIPANDDHKPSTQP